ncbi:hypothetical protein GCM10022252_02330 [Streptosporangium oxazolinicum]|uniref:Uncharacterized protein n=1 Tax=Streptosporangium oxazolinicum TaxID=909287 RepID=A0ABP8A9B9_9ACTN
MAGVREAEEGREDGVLTTLTALHVSMPNRPKAEPLESRVQGETIRFGILVVDETTYVV